MKRVAEAACMDARWSVYASELYGDWNLLWEQSELDYQGYAKFIAEKDGKVVFMEWSYGSCSGCDSWEDQPADDVRADFKRLGMEFKDRATFEVWCMMAKNEEWPELLRKHLSESPGGATEPLTQHVVVGELYKNTKTGGFYRVMDLGIHTETNEPMAHYKQAVWDWKKKTYGDGQGDSYFRPLALFAGKRADGRWYFEKAFQEN